MIPRARFVLLGASNVTLGFPWVVGWIARAAREAEVLGAFGHGRSYGTTTRVLGRELPSIAACGVWRALEQGAPSPTFALVCDVGNDIMYGADPATIATWVDRALSQLDDAGARIALAGLPLASLSELSPARYERLRRVLFPSRHLAFEDALARARDLDARLAEIARARGATRLVPEREWYGLDPIHIRRHARESAWRSWIGALAPVESPTVRRERRVAAWRLVPERRRLFGRLQERTQPSICLDGRIQVALY
ncbi:MAG: hypothetical protein ACKVWV_15040 [Planctomycetota bacterium]